MLDTEASAPPRRLLSLHADLSRTPHRALHQLRQTAVRAVEAYCRALGLRDQGEVVQRALDCLPEPPVETIMFAAIRTGDGQIYYCEPRGSHAEIRATMAEHQIEGRMPFGFDARFYTEEGFVTSYPRFVGRVEAFRIAFAACQPMKPRPGGGVDLLLEDILYREEPCRALR